MRVIFPGSFQPPTIGHVDFICRAAQLFDEVVVAVMKNPGKTYRISPEERVEMLKMCLQSSPNVRVICDEGLLADLCIRERIDAIVRGLRSGQDYEYEKPLATANKAIGAPETIYFSADPAYAHISSTIAADIASHGGPLESFVPAEIIQRVKAAYSK